jgi:Right handed beta helix region
MVRIALLFVTLFATSAGAVTLNPGDNVQAVVNANPAGTTYEFNPGVYRMQVISPKTGDSFIGRPGAILNGSRVLSGWRQQGATWFVGGQTQQGQIHGECIATRPRCNRPEQVFVDGAPLIHVASLAEVNSGSFFFDYPADRIYIGQDPAGKTIETTVTDLAIRPTADNVTVRGLIVEKYANPAQFGAIGGQFARPGWLIENNELRWNNATGVRITANSTLRNNFIHHNGQNGFVADGGTGIRIEGNEVAHNTWNGTDNYWEGGGSKVANSDGAVIRNNYVHHNAGSGLWTDINNINTLYEYNTITDNKDEGIQHEISYAAVIRNNISVRNGFGSRDWFWGWQILVQNSPNVEVHNNYVLNIHPLGEGIGVVESDRGSGTFGPYQSRNANIHDNDIVFPNANGVNGAATDTGNPDFNTSVWNIRFDRNRYHATTTSRQVFHWQGDKTLAQAQAAGQEVGGTIDTNLIAAPATIVNLTDTPSQINAGEQSTLAFEGLLAKNCTAPWKQGNWVSGSVVVSPTTTTTYTLTCDGEGGPVTRNVTVTVGGSLR